MKRSSMLKHGPGGTGASGPCDPHCLKCAAQAEESMTNRSTKTSVSPIAIAPKLLAAVAKWAHAQRHPGNIHMVMFTKTEYVATDGHRIVRVPIRYYGPKFCVDRTHLLAAASAAATLSAELIQIKVDDSGKIELILAPGVVMRVPAGDADKYPPVDEVMPIARTGPPPDPYGMNARYLADIYEIDVAAGKSGGVKITGWGGSLDAMSFKSDSGIRYIVMPIRT